VLAVWILLYLYFHDWRGALRPTISGVICAIWGLGFIRLLGFGLDPLVLIILLVPVLFLQKLAITASFWIAAIIVSELILNPIVYYYLEPPRIDVIERREHGFFKQLLQSIARPMLERSGRIATFAATIAVIALCAFFWSGLKVGDPSSESPIVWPNSAYNRSMAAIQSEFGAIEQFVVVAEFARREALND